VGASGPVITTGYAKTIDASSRDPMSYPVSTFLSNANDLPNGNYVFQGELGVTVTVGPRLFSGLQAGYAEANFDDPPVGGGVLRDYDVGVFATPLPALVQALEPSSLVTSCIALSTLLVCAAIRAVAARK
jgi:hypothetical protein